MTERLALVTGATGFIATRLVPALADAGWEVRATGRRARPDWLPPDVAYAAADLAGEEPLDDLLEGVTHVFHLAGASSSQSSQEEMERSNVGGTARLVAAARSGSIARFVHMSSTSVYGEAEQLPLPVREDAPVHPSRGYGKAKWQAEEQVWEAGAEGLPVVVLRPVSVHGPGAIKLLASAILDVAVERYAGLDRLSVPSEPIEQRLVHVDDLVGAAVHLALHDDAVGRAFNVTSGVYPTSHQVAEELASPFGLPVELEPDLDCGPSYDFRREAHAKMVAEGMEDRILLTEERFRFMRKSNRNNQLSIDALLGTGFELRHTDLATAVAGDVAWNREHRWIL